MQKAEHSFEIRVYQQEDGTQPFLKWLKNLKDSKVRIAVDRRMERVKQGNFGDHRFERDGVWELRIDFGPGYRVYYGLADQQIVLCSAAAQRERKPVI